MRVHPQDLKTENQTNFRTQEFNDIEDRATSHKKNPNSVAQSDG